MSHLPKDQRAQARATLRAAFKLEASEGMAKLERYASWLEREWPGAAASPREGPDELFTANRPGPTSAPRRRPGTTSLIDDSHSAARERMRRVKRRRSGEVAPRRTAASFEAASTGLRRILGYKDIWMPKAALGERGRDERPARQAVAG